MYQIIGLMLTRDDVEILEDWLIKHRSWFDKLYVLDGSIDNQITSKSILNKYDVEYYHDSDFEFTKKTDHTLRGVLFEKIKIYIDECCIHDDFWIVLAHPDEFYINHFKHSIDVSIKNKSNLIIYNVLHNFPHITEKETYKKERNYKVFKHFVHNLKNYKKE